MPRQAALGIEDPSKMSQVCTHPATIRSDLPSTSIGCASAPPARGFSTHAPALFQLGPPTYARSGMGTLSGYDNRARHDSRLLARGRPRGAGTPRDLLSAGDLAKRTDLTSGSGHPPDRPLSSSAGVRGLAGRIDAASHRDHVRRATSMRSLLRADRERRRRSARGTHRKGARGHPRVSADQLRAHEAAHRTGSRPCPTVSSCRSVT